MVRGGYSKKNSERRHRWRTELLKPVHSEKACVHTRMEVDEDGEDIEVYDISC